MQKSTAYPLPDFASERGKIYPSPTRGEGLKSQPNS
ncbi:hypothetical protein MHA_0722 [Mannheimia haemolytica PHL213]|nr:hypothetical protein MHA_0722 [Mannheimia haemolytica PHL213]